LRLSITAHFNKTKTFGASGIALHHDFGTGDGSELTKGLLKITIAHRVRQIANVEFVAHEWDS
jgi:hypothetical protein